MRPGGWENGKIQILISLNVTTLNCIMNNGIYLQRYQRLCGGSVMKRKVVRPVLSLNTQRVDAFIFGILIGTAIVILSFVTLLYFAMRHTFCLGLLAEHVTFYSYAFYIPDCLFMSLNFALYILCS